MSGEQELYSGQRQFEATVLTEEKRYIDAWRAKTRRNGNGDLTGLALSGGGIRSAVFCLGALQAFAKHDILKNFDYLSTVSGGGYIGTSLTWFTQHDMECFGVGKYSFPYGIDDPQQDPPKHPKIRPLLAYLRRNGSYLDPGGTLSLLAGVSVVLRGLVLNLLVIWLPIVTFTFAIIHWLYRTIALCAAHGGPVWLTPLYPALIPVVVFVLCAIVYSLITGVEAKRHHDMPYSYRRYFEWITPYILCVTGGVILLGSLPYVEYLLNQNLATQGVIGFIMTVGGGALGLWSRLAPSGSRKASIPSWAGPIGAALVLYGMALLAYAVSGAAFPRGKAIPQLWEAVAITACFCIALVIGYVVDLNETTLHRFYRDRLMEAFMPDVDAHGAPKRHEAKTADTGRLSQMCDPADPKAPYHLLNAFQIITHPKAAGERRGQADRWRIRGGDSFVFAPRYCGGPAAGWHETAENKTLSALSLATAMAISGAAINPDAATAGVGPERNTVFAILMALLNIRLGYWLANPNRYAGKPHAPAPNSFVPGFWGLIDRLSRRSRFLEIADGGDFDNLGVYELLRRHVQTIVVCDADADPDLQFEDLQTLLNLAEADFGVTITFESPLLGPLMPKRTVARFPLGVGFATAPFLVGKIRYINGDAGRLYYIKPAIFAGLGLSVLGFKGANSEFPNDSTLNQFFDEARFEAYRELGFACVETMLKSYADAGNTQTCKAILEAI
jgi:hypothetical protein